MKFTDVAGIMNIPYVAEKVKLSHVAEIVKLSHVAGILEAGSMYDQIGVVRFLVPQNIRFLSNLATKMTISFKKCQKTRII